MPSRKQEAAELHAKAPQRRGPKRRDTRATAKRTHVSLSASLEELVEARLVAYVESLQGHLPHDLYALVMPQLERPLLRVAMELAEGRPGVAANMLGLHRNTLRARLRELGLEEEPPPSRVARR